MTGKHCELCGESLLGIGDKEVKSSLITQSANLPPFFVGDEKNMADYLFCVDCRAIYRMELAVNGKKWPKLLTCSGCSKPIRYEPKLGYSEIICPTDGFKYMLYLTNPKVIVRQIYP
jgi:hypothetical protein